MEEDKRPGRRLHIKLLTGLIQHNLRRKRAGVNLKSFELHVRGHPPVQGEDVWAFGHEGSMGAIQG